MASKIILYLIMLYSNFLFALFGNDILNGSQPVIGVSEPSSRNCFCFFYDNSLGPLRHFYPSIIYLQIEPSVRDILVKSGFFL